MPLHRGSAFRPLMRNNCNFVHKQQTCVYTAKSVYLRKVYEGYKPVSGNLKKKIKHENKINCFDYEFMFYNKFICSNC
jgi:hypothetical protein